MPKLAFPHYSQRLLDGTTTAGTTSLAGTPIGTAATPTWTTPGGQSSATSGTLPGGDTAASQAALIPDSTGTYTRLNTDGTMTTAGGRTINPNAGYSTVPGGQTWTTAQQNAAYAQAASQLGVSTEAARQYNPATSSSLAMDLWSGYAAWDPTMVDWSTANVPAAARTYWMNLHPEWFE